MTQDEQREEFIERSFETHFYLPSKREPGCYEVMARVADFYLVCRFKTERDAQRFYNAGIRGKAIIL